VETIVAMVSTPDKDRPMKQTSVDTWLSETTRIAVRRWAERAIALNRMPSQTPNAVVRFTQQHAIPLDSVEPRITGRAILQVLARLDSMRDDASGPRPSTAPPRPGCVGKE
jgi:hypothetical protein